MIKDFIKFLRQEAADDNCPPARTLLTGAADELERLHETLTGILIVAHEKHVTEKENTLELIERLCEEALSNADSASSGT